MTNSSARSAILVVDPDPRTHQVFADVVEGLGFRAVRANTAAEALEKFHREPPSLVLLDFHLPDMTGRQLLHHLRTNGTATPVIVLVTSSDIRTAVEAVREGATEVLDKTINTDELRSVLKTILQALAQPSSAARPSDNGGKDRIHFFRQYEQLFRRSDKMRAVERIVVEVADTNATVLIQGETGVGKELVAKAIHYLSSRFDKPWLKVNCASLPPDLLESELFGHEKGAFTGASSRKPGRFELANGGTLFLDEIGEMPLSLQSKILHVLQDNEFFRVGGRELISVDVRILAATNKNIQTMVANGLFREDLYYRLNVVNIFVPPLRERREEIPSLVEHFRAQFNQQYNRRRAELSPDIMELFWAYSWPGNIRELENLIRRFVVLGDEGHLREELQVRLKVTSPQPVLVPPPIMDGTKSLEGLRDIARRAASEAEKAAIKEVLDRVQWNRAAAARLLKISYKTLLSKINQGGFGQRSRRQRSG